jgi:hypothetical protein
MHMLLNENIELGACKRVPSRDFYNVRKVDTVMLRICSGSGFICAELLKTLF